MKKILVIVSTVPGSGGSYQYAHTLLSGLRHIDPALFSFRIWAADQEWMEIIHGLGLKAARKPRFGYGRIKSLLEKLPATSKLRDALVAAWSRFEPLWLYLYCSRTDAVIISDQYSLPLPTFVRQVACIHDLMHRYEPTFPEVSAPDEVRAREERFLSIVARCHGILVDSALGGQHVVESYGASPEKVHPLPFALYDGLTSCLPERPARLPAGFDGNFLFYPAQFWLHKNHLGLLDAVSQIADRLDIRCVFTGGHEKNGSEAVATAIRRMGLESRVQTLGFVTEPELAWLYQHARCMVMPTYFGPTNIPPLEAMYFGCPVAISGIYAIPEQLGDAAVYFPPADPAVMAAQIEKIWSDETLREALIHKGKIRASKASAALFGARLAEILRCVVSHDVRREP